MLSSFMPLQRAKHCVFFGTSSIFGPTLGVGNKPKLEEVHIFHDKRCLFLLIYSIIIFSRMRHLLIVSLLAASAAAVDHVEWVWNVAQRTANKIFKLSRVRKLEIPFNEKNWRWFNTFIIPVQSNLHRPSVRLTRFAHFADLYAQERCESYWRHLFCCTVCCEKILHLRNCRQLINEICQVHERDQILADADCTACYSNPCQNEGQCLPDGKYGYRWVETTHLFILYYLFWARNTRWYC